MKVFEDFFTLPDQHSSFWLVMKLHPRFLLLLLIPIITLFLTLQFNEARGPYYLNVNSDPAYLYLINSLNIATGHAVAHVDNPGTTVQIIGGITIKILSVIQGTKDVQQDVFLHPEYYLEMINKVLLTLNLVVLFLLGVIAFNLTGSVWISLLLQGVPFTSWQVMKALTKVSPEPMLVLFAMLLAMLLLIILQRNDLSERRGRYAFLFALICGAGLVTKLTFFPLLIIPLLLIPSFKWRLAFLLITILVFNILFIPGFSHYDYLLEWTRNLFIHSGHYGEGPADFLNLSDFFANLKEIFVLYHTFFGLLLVIVTFCLYMILSGTSGHFRMHSLEFKILLSVSFAFLVHVIMVAKHHHPHYYIPVLVLCPLTVYLLYKVFQQVNRQGKLLDFIHNPFFRFGLIISVLVLLILRHNANRLIGRSLLEWLNIVIVGNLTLFIALFVFALIFFLVLLFFEISREKTSPVLGIALIFVLAIYQLRHIDLYGFYQRSQFAKQEGLEIIDFVENKNPGYIKVLGDKSSSKYYALKYGAFFNFKQPNHFEKLKALYGDKPIYFWGLEYYPRKFYTWMGETNLDQIFKENENVILQGDTNGLTPGNIHLIEKNNKVKLEPLFKGSLESVYLIQKN